MTKDVSARIEDSGCAVGEGSFGDFYLLSPQALGRGDRKDGLLSRPHHRSDGAGGWFWTPNGRHRLAAMHRLGAKSITALVLPDRELAWQILALNTEKAHNLKERSLEVIRIYHGLVEENPTHLESQFAFYLKEPALVTLGVCHEREPRFAGGSYHPILRRLEEFSDEPVEAAVRVTRDTVGWSSNSKRRSQEGQGTQGT